MKLANKIEIFETGKILLNKKEHCFRKRLLTEIK